jgi:DNA-binding GntR family transcriptional regulator
MNTAAHFSSTAEQIYSSLKERLAHGEFAPGLRLTEEQLARELGTSRTPVREAMRRLVADGLLQFRPNYGTFVGTWTARDVQQLFDLRTMLESEVAAAAAPVIADAVIDQLEVVQEQIEAQSDDIRGLNLERIDPLNRQFHRLIAEAANNPRLVAMLTNAIEAPIVRQTLRRYTQPQLRRSFTHHRELIDAFRARDAAWAHDTMSCHVRAAKFALLGKVSE